MKAKDKKETDLRKEFGDLPLDRKFATLADLEVMTATEAIDKFADLSISFGKKLFEGIFPNCESEDQQDPKGATE
jgi:hypothetical protein